MVAFPLVFALLASLAFAQEQIILDSARDLVLKPLPEKAQADPIALILVPGASVSPGLYRDLAVRIQEQSSGALWVGSPHFVGDVALGKDHVAKAIARVHQQLLAQGLPKACQLFLAGHSLGGAATQEYAVESQAGVEDRLPLAGTVLLSTAVFRKHNSTYPKPWLMVSGSLDGMQRPTRIAETYYHQFMSDKRSSSDTASAAIDTPVVIVEGTNHMQMSTGAVPMLPRFLDLQPEISGQEARSRIAQVVAAFISVHSSSKRDTDAAAMLRSRVKETGQFLDPILKSLLMEASSHLKRPCNSDTPAVHCPYYPAWPAQKDERPVSMDTDCFCGVPWTEFAIQKMANLPPSISLHTADAMHDVRDTHPFHHAHVWNNCTDAFALKQQCTLNVTTVSELVYDRFDSRDPQLTHSTASEIRIKMKSRQTYHRYAVDPLASFSLDDDEMICADINKLAFDWAYENASPEACKRFDRYGQPMEFLPDAYPKVPIGPLWINAALKMKSVVSENNAGEKVLQVQSPSLKTKIDSWINRLHPDSGGQHYCKVLSPARAMEWIYTDGLRAKMGFREQ